MFYSAFAFRSIEEWKTALITLPDSNFFTLVRSVLGNVRSPFNKQRLVDELCAFFQDTETQKIILSYISPLDHKILAAIAVLEEPESGEIETFFSGDLSLQIVQDAIINLEERFLIFRLNLEGVQRLSLNPLLKKILEPFANDLSVLFPCKKEAGFTYQYQAIISDLDMLSLFTFARSSNELFNNDFSVRRTAVSKLKKIFKNRDMIFLLQLLRYLGLLKENLAGFAALSSEERLSYLACGFYLMAAYSDASSFTLKTHISVITAFIHSFCKIAERDTFYPQSTLKHFFEVLQNKSRPNKNAYIFSNEKLNFELFLDALVKTGILVQASTTSEPPLYLFRPIDTAKDKGNDATSPRIVFDSAYTFVLLPEISFNEAAPLINFCDCIQAGDPTRFEISKESFVRGLNAGLTVPLILDILQALSAGRLNPNIMSMLYDWEKRYNGTGIFEGITLVLSEERQFIEQTKDFKAIMLSNPAKGVYLIDSHDREKLINTLKRSGIDILAELPQRKKEQAQTVRSVFKPLPTVKKFDISSKGQSKIQYKSGDQYKSDFQKILDTMPLNHDEYDEFKERIERGLIISPRQLDKASLKYEKREAHSLDYKGKLAITKQALLSHELLELVYQDKTSKTTTIRGYAKTLEKNEADTILCLEQIENTDTIIKVAIGKIQILRKIKQSIFSI